MNIISLLPSATEIVCALGLEDQLVGVTHECDYPPSVKRLPKVTRTLIPHDTSSQEIDYLVRERLKTQAALYSLDIEVLEHLQPDLIVTQSLCDVCAVAEAEVQEAACRLPGQPRILNLEPMSLLDMFETLRMVGRAAEREEQALHVVQDLQARVEAVLKRTAAILMQERPRVAFLVVYHGRRMKPPTAAELRGISRVTQAVLWQHGIRTVPSVASGGGCNPSRPPAPARTSGSSPRYRDAPPCRCRTRSNRERRPRAGA